MTNSIYLLLSQLEDSVNRVRDELKNMDEGIARTLKESELALIEYQIKDMMLRHDIPEPKPEPKPKVKAAPKVLATSESYDD